MTPLTFIAGSILLLLGLYVFNKFVDALMDLADEKQDGEE